MFTYFTSIRFPPFFPSLISLTVSVDVKHYVYLLISAWPNLPLFWRGVVTVDTFWVGESLRHWPKSRLGPDRKRKDIMASVGQFAFSVLTLFAACGKSSWNGSRVVQFDLIYTSLILFTPPLCLPVCVCLSACLPVCCLSLSLTHSAPPPPPPPPPPHLLSLWK